MVYRILKTCHMCMSCMFLLFNPFLLEIETKFSKNFLTSTTYRERICLRQTEWNKTLATSTKCNDALQHHRNFLHSFIAKPLECINKTNFLYKVLSSSATTLFIFVYVYHFHLFLINVRKRFYLWRKCSTSIDVHRTFTLFEKN